MVGALPLSLVNLDNVDENDFTVWLKVVMLTDWKGKKGVFVIDCKITWLERIIVSMLHAWH